MKAKTWLVKVNGEIKIMTEELAQAEFWFAEYIKRGLFPIIVRLRGTK
jgi:hypothetical protein